MRTVAAAWHIAHQTILLALVIQTLYQLKVFPGSGRTAGTAQGLSVDFKMVLTALFVTGQSHST